MRTPASVAAYTVRSGRAYSRSVACSTSRPSRTSRSIVLYSCDRCPTFTTWSLPRSRISCCIRYGCRGRSAARASTARARPDRWVIVSKVLVSSTLSKAVPVVGSVPRHESPARGVFGMRHDDWFLTDGERGNPACSLPAWCTGNQVRPLVDGAQYFARLVEEVSALGPGDLLFFTDWRGDADQRLTADGPTVGALFADAARRGVVVKGLMWRSHSDELAYSEQENRQLGDEVREAGGEVLL